MIKQPRILPMSLQEAKILGIEQFDVILISGDAYVDHPSFGAALIGRVLWDAGYTVGIIAQPDWKRDDDFLKLGRPRLFFGVSSGKRRLSCEQPHAQLEAPQLGCLFSGRSPLPARQGCDSLRKQDSRPLSWSSDHNRRNRGQLAQVCPLRLLVGLGAPVHSG